MGGGCLGVQPLFKALDVEVDGFQEAVLDAELAEEGDFGRPWMFREGGVIERDVTARESSDQAGGIGVDG